MDKTLRAIEKHGMIFISAQPDEVYFHWQVELYLHQFSKHGILDKCYAVFCYKGDGPSDQLKDLMKMYRNIICYKDTRLQQPKYVPLVRPYLLKQFFKDHPELGKNVFYHDSDIFLVNLPKFELMLGDTSGYLSNTISYIGYNYLKICSARYKDKHPSLPDDDLFIQMCNIMEIEPELVKQNEKKSGGAQYLLKNINVDYWEKVEKSTMALYNFLNNYEAKYPVAHHVQTWATDMWAVLWEYWKMGNNTVVHDELNFSWATDSVSNYFKRNIFHLAGVKANTAKDKFYKGQYKNKNAIKEYMADNSIFDHISPNNATYEYIAVLKKYVGNNGINEPERFKIVSNNHWDNVYKKQQQMFFGKHLWKSLDNNYTIFYNKRKWVLTASKYEAEFSETCGGFANNSAAEPYEYGWNVPKYNITIL